MPGQTDLRLAVGDDGVIVGLDEEAAFRRQPDGTLDWSMPHGLSGRTVGVASLPDGSFAIATRNGMQVWSRDGSQIGAHAFSDAHLFDGATAIAAGADTIVATETLYDENLDAVVNVMRFDESAMLLQSAVIAGAAKFSAAVDDAGNLILSTYAEQSPTYRLSKFGPDFSPLWETEFGDDSGTATSLDVNSRDAIIVSLPDNRVLEVSP